MPYQPISLEWAIYEVALFSIELSRNIEIEMTSGGDHTIDHTIKRGVAGNFYRMYFCDYSVAKELDGKAGPQVQASISIVFELNGGASPPDDYVQKISSTTCWQRFVSIYNSIISQTDIKFPSLPSMPPPANLRDLAAPPAELTI